MTTTDIVEHLRARHDGLPVDPAATVEQRARLAATGDRIHPSFELNTLRRVTVRNPPLPTVDPALRALVGPPDGTRFVHVAPIADLLAAAAQLSGDDALAECLVDADPYAAAAARLGSSRAEAKEALFGAFIDPAPSPVTTATFPRFAELIVTERKQAFVRCERLVAAWRDDVFEAVTAAGVAELPYAELCDLWFATPPGDEAAFAEIARVATRKAQRRFGGVLRVDVAWRSSLDTSIR